MGFVNRLIRYQNPQFRENMVYSGIKTALGRQQSGLCSQVGLFTGSFVGEIHYWETNNMIVINPQTVNEILPILPRTNTTEWSKLESVTTLNEVSSK